jgi:hypothetical protein
MARTPARIGKTVPLTKANDPVSFPTGGKPPVPDTLKGAPRADGAADGTTGGNFRQPAINTGAGFPQQHDKPGTGSVE